MEKYGRGASSDLDLGLKGGGLKGASQSGQFAKGGIRLLQAVGGREKLSTKRSDQTQGETLMVASLNTMDDALGRRLGASTLEQETWGGKSLVEMAKKK